MLTTLIARFRFATQKEKNLHLFVRHLLQVAFTRLFIASFICALKSACYGRTVVWFCEHLFDSKRSQCQHGVSSLKAQRSNRRFHQGLSLSIPLSMRVVICASNAR
jgi:hypothetical protein